MNSFDLLEMFLPRPLPDNHQPPEDDMPDGTTLWVFREKLAKVGLIEKLSDRFNQHLNANDYIARGGQKRWKRNNGVVVVVLWQAKTGEADGNR
jgi:hypothetical protein